MADDLQVVDSKPQEATSATGPASTSGPVDTIGPRQVPGWLDRVEQADPAAHPVFGPVLKALQAGAEYYHQTPAAHAAETGVTPEVYEKAQAEHDAQRSDWMKGLTDESKWYNQPFARFRAGLDRMSQDLHDYAETHKGSLTPAAYLMLHGAAAAGELTPVGSSAAGTAMAWVALPELGGEGRLPLDVNDVHQAAKAAGVEYRGLQEGIPGKLDDHLIFQDPKSGTSVAVKRGEFTPEKLAEHVEAARVRMAPGAKLPEDLATRAKRLYGATLDHEALANGERAMGFYLPDGSFVGHPNEKTAYERGVKEGRPVDTHPLIADHIVNGNSPQPESYEDALERQGEAHDQFVKETGAIRMHNAEGEANVELGSKRPTPEQLESIAKLAKASDGKVVWDMGRTTGEGSMGDLQRALDQRYGKEPTTLAYTGGVPDRDALFDAINQKAPGNRVRAGQLADLHVDRLTHPEKYNPAEVEQSKNAVGMWLGPERRQAPRAPTTLAYKLPGEPLQGFYSPAQRAAEARLQDGMTGEQALATLKNTPGVKPAELKFTGLEDFLQGKNKVSKQEVLDHLAENEVQVKETRLGETTQDQFKSWTVTRGVGPNRSIVVKDERGRPVSSFSEQQHHEMSDGELKKAAWLGTEEPEKETQYEQYTLPGPKENYRELLFNQPGKKEFKAAHFGQYGQNLLAHARVTDRVINGKKTLFVEELQSDWARTLREEGPKRSRNLEVMTVDSADKLNPNQTAHPLSGASTKGYEHPVKRTDYVVFDHDRNSTIDFPNRDAYWPRAGTKEEAERHLETLKGQASQTGVAPQPFRDWHELVLKRLLRMAGEEGYDQIAWTTGKQQAERYSIGAVADHLIYDPKSEQLHVYKNDRLQRTFDDVTKNKLAEYVGNDAAQKLVDSPLSSLGYHNLATKDLPVGARWASHLYDEMAPAFVDKFGKQWGLKTEAGKVTTEGEMRARASEGGKKFPIREEDVHVVPLTDEFKKALPTTRFPLFRTGGVPGHVMTHEWGHATVAAAHGFHVEDMVGPGHPALPHLAEAGARIDIPELQQGENGFTLTDTTRLPQILEVAAGGAAAEELAGGQPWHENKGFTGDGDLMYEVLRNAGFGADEATRMMDQYVQKAKGTLSHERLKGLTPPAETGELMPGQLVSGKTMQAHVNEVRRRLYGEGDDAGGAQGGGAGGGEAKPRGEGGAARPAEGAAALSYSETKSGEINPAPYAKRAGGVGGDGQHLVDQLIDEGAQEAPARQTHNGLAVGVVLPKDLTLYHSTNSTAAKDIVRNGLKPLSHDLGHRDLSTNLGTRPLAEGFANVAINDTTEPVTEHEVLFKVHLPKGTKIYRDDYPNDPMHIRVFHRIPPEQLEIVKGGRKDIKLRQNVADNETMADPDTRFSAARHEAGHAVVAELTRPGSVDGMSLDERGGLTDIKNPAGVTSPSGLSPDQVKDLVAMSYAGGLEEPGGTTVKHVSGDTKVRERLLGPQGLSANEEMAAARARVNALLADPANRAKIDQVAKTLNEKGRLTGDEVRKLLGGK